MCNLTFLEKNKFEKLFGMGTGYVLDFTDRTFGEFIAESTGRNIWDTQYALASGSKANRLRAFWKHEPNHIVGKLMTDLLNYCWSEVESVRREPDFAVYGQCRSIVERLIQETPIQEAEVISAVAAGKDFEALAQSIKDAINKNSPETGLDRLHTFTTKYIRHLCEKHGVPVHRDKPLHSLFGEYIKHLRKSGLLESEMTERILKSSISILESFNEVRNEHSFAHDNPVLNYGESLLIFNNVTSSIRFISALESTHDMRSLEEKEANDIPF
jgi:Abortive infection C-terminus